MCDTGISKWVLKPRSCGIRAVFPAVCIPWSRTQLCQRLAQGLGTGLEGRPLSCPRWLDLHDEYAPKDLMDPQENPGFLLQPDAEIQTCVNCLTLGRLYMFPAIQETGLREERECFPPEREQVAGLRPISEQGLYFHLSTPSPLLHGWFRASVKVSVGHS